MGVVIIFQCQIRGDVDNLNFGTPCIEIVGDSIRSVDISKCYQSLRVVLGEPDYVTYTGRVYSHEKSEQRDLSDDEYLITDISKNYLYIQDSSESFTCSPATHKYNRVKLYYRGDNIV